MIMGSKKRILISLRFRSRLGWGLKKVLQGLPPKKPGILNRDNVTKVGFLFSGTFGDAVQCISILNKIEREFPTASLSLFMEKKQNFGKMWCFCDMCN